MREMKLGFTLVSIPLGTYLTAIGKLIEDNQMYFAGIGILVFTLMYCCIAVFTGYTRETYYIDFLFEDDDTEGGV